MLCLAPKLGCVLYYGICPRSCKKENVLKRSTCLNNSVPAAFYTIFIPSSPQIFVVKNRLSRYGLTIFFMTKRRKREKEKKKRKKGERKGKKGLCKSCVSLKRCYGNVFSSLC